MTIPKFPKRLRVVIEDAFEGGALLCALQPGESAPEATVAVAHYQLVGRPRFRRKRREVAMTLRSIVRACIQVDQVEGYYVVHAHCSAGNGSVGPIRRADLDEAVSAALARLTDECTCGAREHTED